MGRAQKQTGDTIEASTPPHGTHASQRKLSFERRPTSRLFRATCMGFRPSSARASVTTRWAMTSVCHENLDAAASSEARDDLESLKGDRTRSFDCNAVERGWCHPAASHHIAPAKGCGTCFDLARHTRAAALSITFAILVP